MENIPPTHQSIPQLPAPFSATELAHNLAQWLEAANRMEDKKIAAWMHEAAAENSRARQWLAMLFGNSPYLSRLLLLYPQVLRDVMEQGADSAGIKIMSTLFSVQVSDDYQELMRHLRTAKGKLALLVAIADVADLWPLEQVTSALSVFAERSLVLALDAILVAAHKRGEIELKDMQNAASDSGIIVLALGKLGGNELNYSSDIDLIIFFERDRLVYKGRHNEQHFMNKVAHELVHIMQERTAEGYVFRTDLRLRPDPASTPPAVNTEAAYYYYEGVGQNWERAAMIKARVVAGDRVASERFLKGLTPFMWRRSLDFAAINDIHSIKRQMDTRENKEIKLRGHNIKLGLGGIREIEFYVQIHQLIWGGREPRLRMRATCEALEGLVELGLIDHKKEHTLKSAYIFLRKLEHRLQMIADEQTHSLPETDEEIERIAYFMGYGSTEELKRHLFSHLYAVHDIYSTSFRSAEKLGDEGNLVFTGTLHDPETLKTLRTMGYENAEMVSEIVMGWHHGSRRATRTKRARELLTELMPTLLKRLAATANPDAAFLKFNEFLVNLPAGVQLFSLFSLNPQLLDLIANIMGSAPTLAERLSKSPGLLDAVLYADFYEPLPSIDVLSSQWREMIGQEDDFETRMERLHSFRNEKQFQAGVQLLNGMIEGRQAGLFLSGLADIVISETVKTVAAEFNKTYGYIAGGSFAVIALGKLGSREMTFGSDIDLIFVYDAPDNSAVSDGEKKFTASVYYNRFAQRLLNTLTAMGRDGRLYEVDTRLRPAGKQGMLATSMQGLEQYFSESAWTFEYMAFTKARVSMGDMQIADNLQHFIQAQILKSRDRVKLRADVVDMRERVHKEFATENPWNIKYVRGGQMDLDFMAQYLLLLHAPDTPDPPAGCTAEIVLWLKKHGHMDETTASHLLAAERFLGQLFHMLRLCSEQMFDEAVAMPGLKKLLAQTTKSSDFIDLKHRLLEVEGQVMTYYNSLLTIPKEDL